MNPMKMKRFELKIKAAKKMSDIFCLDHGLALNTNYIPL